MYEMFQHYKTENLEFTDIYKLSEPIKKLEKGKWLPDIYFIEKTLKEYAGVPVDYEIKAFIEHGVQLSNVTEGGFQVHPSQPSIVSSSFRVSVIEGVPGNNGAYAVGPYIAYAKSALSNSELRAEKERLGRNLLVFPAHSIRGLMQVYDVDEFCEKIKDVAKGYDSVRVCLYWKDVLLGIAEKYKNYGFEVVTAGHYYDPMFMPRLKSIIQTSTMTMSNDLGSYVGYSIYLNKPHLFLKSELEVEKIVTDGEEFAESQLKAYREVDNKIKNEADIDLMVRLLSKNQEFITEDQYNLLNKYWGFDQVKTPKQLRKLILEIEGLNSLNNPQSYNDEIKRLRNQLNAENYNTKPLNNEIKRLSNQLNAEKTNVAKILPIRGFIEYKTKNLAKRFKEKVSKSGVKTSSSVITDNKLLIITSSDPACDALDVARDKVITVAFSEPIKNGNGWIELKKGNGYRVPVITSINGNVLTINHAELFEIGTRYDVILHTGSVTDLAGNALAVCGFNFTTSTDNTVPSTDNTALTVISSDPVRNALDVARDKLITVAFSEPIKNGNGWIELKKGNGYRVPVITSINGNVLTINHAELFEIGTRYDVILHTGSVTDLAGNALAVCGFSFTTNTT